MKKCLLILLHFSSFAYAFAYASSALAQGPTTYWHFGMMAGMKFENYNPTSIESNVLTMYAGCSSISTANSELLYYANPDSLISSNNVATPGSENLMGSITSSQGALFVPNPSNPYVHYLFTHSTALDSTRGLYVTTIERTMQNNLGAVPSSTKNIHLDQSICQRITAVHHANGRDVWVLHRVALSDTILAFLVTEGGVSTVPVVSIVDSLTGLSGQLKSSPNGKLLSECVTWQQSGIIPSFALHQFNNATGAVSNTLTFILPDTSTYGTEFSSDGNWVYYSYSSFPDTNQIVELIRFNVSAYDSTTIANSIDLVSTVPVIAPLQIGIDRKIYVGHIGFGYLGRVENPNASSSNLNYTDSAIYLQGNTAMFGLPDFIQSYFHPAYFDFWGSCVGRETHFAVRNPGVDSVLWDFGDPSSGTSNQSTLLNPQHQYVQSGSFIVTLIVSNAIGSDTFTRTIDVQLGPSFFDFQDTMLICPGEILDFDLEQSIPMVYYWWSTGSDSSGISISDTDLYWCTIYNYCDTISDTFRIAYHPTPNIDLGPDTSVCQGDSFWLSPGISPQAEFVWSDGDTASLSYLVGSFDSDNLQPRTIWLHVDHTCDQGFEADTVQISFIIRPDATLPDDTVNCLNQPVNIPRFNEDGVNYLWSDSTSGLHYRAVKDSVIWLQASNICGLDLDSMSVAFHPEIEVELIDLWVICEGDSVLLNATWPGSTYAWNTGGADSIVVAKDMGNYVVTITNGPCAVVEQSQVIWDDNECDHSDCQFTLSNVFTPNGDGVNDELQITNLCPALRFEVSIFNRWGQLVYASTSRGRCSWDGFTNGTAMSSGTYYIMIEYTLQEEQKIVAESVELLR